MTDSASAPGNTLKRKDRPDETEEKPPIATAAAPSGANPRPDEYETGRVNCETCGASVSFRDEQTGGFTVSHWEAHRQTCAGSSNPPPGEPVIFTPESTAEALSQPPAKRRRAKRTEEERIEYLRADPYVGQFEAYRVLCASCDKWIRLRPNSTYCSIPWDAHRKSCLAKKINNKNVYALEERNTLFSKDPDVRKFDPERVLCNTCDRWISVPPDDHLQAVQQWLQHRASCHRNSGSSAPSGHRSEQPQSGNAAPASPSANPHSSASNSASPVTQPASASAHGGPHVRYPNIGSPTSFHDLTPSNYAPAHESRRRNAEQRAATLRADRLIGEVEPNRVFCSLCQKWVQLRQDSSYCAYPWLQHRGKCLARHQRRAQKAAEIADMKARKMPHGGGPLPPHEEDELASDHEGMGGGDRFRRTSSLGAESEEGIERDIPDDHNRMKDASRRAGVNENHFRHSSSSRQAYYGSYQQQPHHTKHRSTPYGGNPTNGRYGGGSIKQFVFGSVEYLFATTYEASDEMSISALLAYLNAAMPPDKHEDFDTSEVARAVQAMKDKGRVVFEGDILRLVD
ncbi:hypothetical protein CVT26_012932 [Gymnopilus dilepis]|uniref:Uncharacterized protein n=1 Tax=Gymnopilus dilepis TaxID=231916 RepID=A0A409Y459_9AGAR|nr:hypothetical protein CVT26_012932 [Gymnopilus dilepis]